MSSNDSSTFASFLADVLRRIDRGEAIDREQLLAKHEDLRPQLESFFRGQSLVGDLLGGVAGRVGRVPEAHADAIGQPSPLGRFADFELLEEIGRGGMGVVYRARQLRPDRIVALKMVLSGRHASQKSLRRFYLEAQAAARLRHPSIVPIHQVGEHDGLAYYVMDFIEGESLDDRLARGPLPPKLAAHLLLEITRAVAHAHAQGVIHRDLKPANVLIEMRNDEQMRNAEFGMQNEQNSELRIPHSALYIADFGLARLLDLDEQLTATGDIVGTASYMAPEQAGFVGRTFLSGTRGRLECLPHSADIYGLGAILYAMLTGRPPFQAASRDETIAQLKTKEPAPPRTINAAIPRDLETIALKCLQKFPARRYLSAKALADDLECYLAGKPIAARPVCRMESGWRWARRNKSLVSGMASVALILIFSIAGGVYLQQRQADEARRAAALYGAQVLLRTEHTAGWTEAHQERISAAARIRADEAVRDHFVASLDGVDARRIKQLQGGSTSSLQFCGDGQRLLIAGTEKTPARLWDHSTDRTHFSSRPGQGIVAFDANGTPRQLTVVDDGLVLMELTENPKALKLELPNGEWRLRFNSEQNPVLALAGDRAAAAIEHSDEDAEIVIWDTTVGAIVRRLTCHAEALSLTPDASVLAAAGRDGDVVTWDVQSGKTLWTANNKRIAIHCLAFAADRRSFARRVRSDHPHNWLLATGDAGGTVTVWDVGLGAPRAFCHGSHYDVYSLAFSADATILASSGRETSNLWDSQTGKLLLRVSSGLYGDAVALSADASRLATCDRDGGGRVHVWELEWHRGQQSLRGLTSQVVRVAFSPDGRLVAALSNDWQIGVWERQPGQLLHVFESCRGYTADNSGLAFGPDNRTLACVAGNELRIWDVQAGNALGKPASFPPGLTDTLAFIADNRILVGREETKDGTVAPGSNAPPSKYPRVYRLREVWLSGESQLVGTITDLNHDIGAAVMASDGSFVVLSGKSGTNGEREAVQVYNSSAELMRSIPLQRGKTTHFLLIDPANHRVGFATGMGSISILAMPQAIPAGAIHRDARSLAPGAKIYAAYNPTVTGDVGIPLMRPNDGATFVTLDLGGPLPPGFPYFDTSGDLFAWGRRDGTVAVADLETARRELAKLDLGWEQ